MTGARRPRTGARPLKTGARPPRTENGSPRCSRDRKGIRDALVVIGKIGRDFRDELRSIRDDHGKLLREIRDAVRRNGNGHR
jgi:hypothetical protein